MPDLIYSSLCLHLQQQARHNRLAHSTQPFAQQRKASATLRLVRRTRSCDSRCVCVCVCWNLVLQEGRTRDNCSMLGTRVSFRNSAFVGQTSCGHGDLHAKGILGSHKRRGRAGKYTRCFSSCCSDALLFKDGLPNLQQHAIR